MALTAQQKLMPTESGSTNWGAVVDPRLVWGFRSRSEGSLPIDHVSIAMLRFVPSKSSCVQDLDRVVHCHAWWGCRRGIHEKINVRTFTYSPCIFRIHSCRSITTLCRSLRWYIKRQSQSLTTYAALIVPINQRNATNLSHIHTLIMLDPPAPTSSWHSYGTGLARIVPSQPETRRAHNHESCK